MIVMTYGTFDLLHWGHINLLQRAKEQGHILIVGLSTDEFNASKGKKAFHSFEHRKRMLESIRYVDHVVEERTWDQKREDMKKYNVDLLVMGDDWKGAFDFLSDCVEVRYLERTKGVSTKEIIDKLQTFERKV